MTQPIKEEDAGKDRAPGKAGDEANDGVKQQPPPAFDASARAPAVHGGGPPVHDDSQMDHPRGPLNEKFKFFLANLPPSVTALEMRRHFEAYGNVNFVKLIYNKTTGEDTDRRVEEYSVRNNYRIRFANFSRIYLQRNDKTRTRPMRGDGKPVGGGHFRQDNMARPYDRPPPPSAMNGDRKPRSVKEEMPPLRQPASNQPRFRHDRPPIPPPPLPRVERSELWQRYPADRVQPEHPPAPRGYHHDLRGHDSGYYGQGPASAEYYEDQQHHAGVHGPTGGYEDYQQSYNEAADYHHHGYSEQGYGQQAHSNYGDHSQGYLHDDGQHGYYDGGNYNETGVYQQGEYFEGNHSSEAYAHPQQHGIAQQGHDRVPSQHQSYPAESSYQGPREHTSHAYQEITRPQAILTHKMAVIRIIIQIRLHLAAARISNVRIIIMVVHEEVIRTG